LLQIVETILISWVTKVQIIVWTTVVYVDEDLIEHRPINSQGY